MNFHPALWLASADVTLPLTIFVVFGTAKVLEDLFERIRVPGIVGNILAGLLIGPGVLGWIKPNEFLTALAELGVMFLLFQVGLHVKSSELMKVGGTAVITALLGVAVPFALGWGILSLWGEPQIEAIFVGAAMVATSVGITARVLADKGYLQLRASKIILAAAVIDDVVGLLVLALVSGMAKGAVNYAELATTAALAIGFTVLVAKWGTRAMGRIVKRTENLNVSESQFALSMVLLFGLSVVSVYMGVAAIIGAFLAGMALSENVSKRVNDLVFGVSELLVPFFLAGIGLHMDLSALTNTRTLLLAVVILIAAVLSKIVGCGLGAINLGRLDAVRIGVGMVPRGEVGMVVAQIGLGLGVVSQPIYGVVVFMAVMTTVVAPPMLNWAYRGADTEDEMADN
ncbi:MAG: cation:proton antiporter [Bryobacterales bacterium]|nr:cation:proton antiporter [Bryobacterales bacterium]